MQKLTVQVCVCPECVMNGAMDIMEAIESLKKLKVQLSLNASVNIVPCANLGGEHHGSKSPIVVVNNETIENANAETVMSKVLNHLQ